MVNQGLGKRVGDSRYLINGRVYAHKPDGRAYPERGEGVVFLTRLQWLLLCLLIEHGGRTVGFDRATEHDPDIFETDIVIALNLFRIRKDE